jgi:hypothetical protein
MPSMFLQTTTGKIIMRVIWTYKCKIQQRQFPNITSDIRICASAVNVHLRFRKLSRYEILYYHRSIVIICPTVYVCNPNTQLLFVVGIDIVWININTKSVSTIIQLQNAIMHMVQKNFFIERQRRILTQALFCKFRKNAFSYVAENLWATTHL